MSDNQIGAYGWPLSDTQLTAVVHPISGGADFQLTAQNQPAPWNPSSETFTKFDPGSYTLKPGDTLTVTDGVVSVVNGSQTITGDTYTKQTIITSMHITSVDPDNGSVSGVGAPNGNISVWIDNASTKISVDVTADGKHRKLDRPV